MLTRRRFSGLLLYASMSCWPFGLIERCREHVSSKVEQLETAIKRKNSGSGWGHGHHDPELPFE
ncbi:hypothetical protein CWS02_25070 [Enterobacter sp. EA-1]|nr:hypothetical protein CWS02_25070 [Enterobacter sp. EA-1]